jgi:glutathione S-transferase
MLTLYILQNTLAFRIAWLLEELGIDYELKFAERREDRSVPPSLGVPTTIGKSPAIKDDDINVGELGAITE